jgi:hypothetical protein
MASFSFMSIISSFPVLFYIVEIFCINFPWLGFPTDVKIRLHMSVLIIASWDRSYLTMRLMNLITPSIALSRSGLEIALLRNVEKHFIILSAYFAENDFMIKLDCDILSTESRISLISLREVQLRMKSWKMAKSSSTLFSNFSIDHYFVKRYINRTMYYFASNSKLL